MSLPDEFLDELRGRIGLVQLVGRRVKLVRAGREWKGCCPFHNEKSPSFFVNEDKGFYHCFGCGAHGDAIRFVMEQDGLPFPEAVRMLAADAGLAVPETRQADHRRDERAVLRDLMAAAGVWFEAQLQAATGSAARAYLEARQVPPALARQFGVGFAPDSGEALLRHLQTNSGADTAARMLEAGLAGESEGRRYDRFRGRLMFPIHDPRGRPVGFGGRILGNGEPKYLNSPEGPLFHKGRLLYNYHRAAPAARKSGRLLVVEGYLDVIGLARAGVAEAVAPLGTALTEEQLQLAWRLAEAPVLAFDGDAAGLRAGTRAAVRALPLIEAGKSLAFTLLPAGQDPDDLAKAGGKVAIGELLARAVPLERFLFDAEHGATPLDTPERRAALRARLRALAADIRDPELRRDYLATWNERAAALSRPRPPAAAAGSRGRRDFRRPFAPAGALAETRAAAGLPTEIHIGMLLRLLGQRLDLAERHAEELVLLALSSPALCRARDLLLDGNDPGELLSGYRPLSFGGEEEGARLEREVASTLAQCLSTHQIAALERQAENPGSEQSLQQAYARNRAAALQVMDRLGLTPVDRGNNGRT